MESTNPALIRSVLFRPTRDPDIAAYVSVTLDGWRIHNLRITRDPRPRLLMPVRDIMERCFDCGHSNPIVARFCSECGIRLPTHAICDHHPDSQGGQRTTLEVAHPVWRSAWNEAIDRLIRNPEAPQPVPDEADREDNIRISHCPFD